MRWAASGRGRGGASGLGWSQGWGLGSGAGPPRLCPREGEGTEQLTPDLFAVEVHVAQQDFGGEDAGLAQVVHLEEFGVLHSTGVVDVGQPVLALRPAGDEGFPVQDDRVIRDSAR